MKLKNFSMFEEDRNHEKGANNLTLSVSLSATKRGRGGAQGTGGTSFLQTKTLSILLVAFTIFAALATQLRADPAPKGAPDIYDVTADGSKQIADALATVKKDGGKIVLVQFGANWCGWCHKLHKLFDTDAKIAEELKSHYVVVMVDVDKEHNKDVNAKYGNPTQHGLPVIVLLDADGKQLTTKDTGELESGDHHDPDKVLTFLKTWSAKK
jgi:thiol-disulfide isomerase/thioredoxin